MIRAKDKQEVRPEAEPSSSTGVQARGACKAAQVHTAY